MELIDYCRDLTQRTKSSKFRTMARSEGRLEEIIEATSFLEEGVKFAERIYCLINEITTRSLCKCGEYRKFPQFSIGYFSHCSVKCSSNSKEKKQAIINTNLEKYGHENAFHSPEGREAWLGADKDSWRNSSRIAYQKVVYKNGGQHPMKIAELKIVHEVRDQLIKSYINKGLYKVEIPIESRYNSLIKYQHTCIKCKAKFYRVIGATTINKECPCCSKYLSEVNKKVNSFLLEEGFDTLLEGKLGNSRSCKYDIVIPNRNVAIELHGVYWHCENSRGKTKRGDHLKKLKQANSFDYSLIQILDCEWQKKTDICKSLILNKLGKVKTKVFARKCLVKSIDHSIYKNFINSNHLQGYAYAKYCYGLYYEGDLVMVISFSNRNFTGVSKMELVRLCSKLNTSVVGGASKLFKCFIKEQNPKEVISYADRRYSEGKVYKSLGFEFDSFTPPSYQYTKNYVDLESRFKYQKHKLVNTLDEFDSALSEWENMKNNKFDRIWDCGNYLFKWHAKGFTDW